ncbi:hypothetical protein SLEP1_g24673 [Rubroshorea leprosula]|uniref:Uncharacterized protein n=1 Tax=Rubroshorea leprosula TaxID=152421 RepID=A0AAV5JQX2_9ROSI|nr:hypothetical protein SLEP1_g24673 [Rubroshorea leprosula]
MAEVSSMVLKLLHPLIDNSCTDGSSSQVFSPSISMLFSWGKSPNSNLFNFGRRSWIIPSESHATEDESREDEERIQKGVLRQHITNPDQQPVVLDFDGEDTSDTESDEFISLTSISRRDVKTPCLEDETNVHRSTLCIPTLGKESKEEVVKEGLYEKESERQGAEPFSDGPEYNSDKPSSQNTETAHLSQRQAEAGISGVPKEIPKEVLRQHRTNPDQQPIVLNFDGEDTSDIENDEHIPSSSTVGEKEGSVDN